MSIIKKIDGWQQSDIVSQEQSHPIAEFEFKTTKHYLAYGLILLCSLFIGTGIITLMASNWNGISPFIKLLVDFVMLISCGAGVYYAYDKGKNIQFEVLLLLFGFLCAATIGLIDQKILKNICNYFSRRLKNEN